jgi:hypothetical protein
MVYNSGLNIGKLDRQVIGIVDRVNPIFTLSLDPNLRKLLPILLN